MQVSVSLYRLERPLHEPPRGCEHAAQTLQQAHSDQQSDEAKSKLASDVHEQIVCEAQSRTSNRMPTRGSRCSKASPIAPPGVSTP